LYSFIYYNLFVFITNVVLNMKEEVIKVQNWKGSGRSRNQHF